MCKYCGLDHFIDLRSEDDCLGLYTFAQCVRRYYVRVLNPIDTRRVIESVRCSRKLIGFYERLQMCANVRRTTRVVIDKYAIFIRQLFTKLYGYATRATRAREGAARCQGGRTEVK